MWITTSNNGININASFIITPNIWFDSVKREILRCLIYDPINECAQNFHWSCLNCVQNLKTKANPRLTLSKQTGVTCTCKHTRIYLIFNSAVFFFLFQNIIKKILLVRLLFIKTKERSRRPLVKKNKQLRQRFFIKHSEISNLWSVICNKCRVPLFPINECSYMYWLFPELTKQNLYPNYEPKYIPSTKRLLYNTTHTISGR